MLSLSNHGLDHLLGLSIILKIHAQRRGWGFLGDGLGRFACMVRLDYLPDLAMRAISEEREAALYLKMNQ